MTPDAEPDRLVMELPDGIPDVVPPGLAGWPGGLPTVPEPRPELLARVLEGLRGLPPRPDIPAAGADDAGSDDVPLPRRRP